MDWYVLQAFSGYENKVKLTLEDRIKRSGLQDSFEEILVPTEEVLAIKEGKKKRSELEKQKQGFIEGAIKNGITKDVAAGIFLKIEP